MICEDSIFEVCKFLSRKQLACIEISCRIFHKIVSSDQLGTLHLVHKPLNLSVPVVATRPTAALDDSSSSSSSATEECEGFFVLADRCFGFGYFEPPRLPPRVLYQSMSTDETIPHWVRCKYISIKDLTDERLLQFCERVAHIFHTVDRVTMLVPLEMPTSHWTRLLALIQPASTLHIWTVLPDSSTCLFQERNIALGNVTAMLRNGKITIEQHRHDCHRLLEKFKQDIGMGSRMSTKKREAQDIVVANLLIAWLHCRCCGGREDDVKLLHLWDNAHLMVPTMREMLVQMQRVCELLIFFAATHPLVNRQLELHLDSHFVKDLVEGTNLNNLVMDKISTQANQAIGETLTIKLQETIYNLDGEIVAIRR